MLVAEHSNQQIYLAFDILIAVGFVVCLGALMTLWKNLIKGADYLGGDQSVVKMFVVITNTILYCSNSGQS